MTKISSAMTGYYKRGFPLIWFGFLAFFVGTTITAGAVEKDVFFLVIPCFMAIVGFL